MSKDMDKAFFGHPAGLSTLFFTEMWERLSYYGARTFLAIYMVADVSVGGRGMSDGATGLVMALYMSSVYLLSLPGGWIADRFIGQRKAVTIGGIGIALGNAMLAMPLDSLFFPGLAVIAVGTGFLKPNISTLVGQLYKPDDVRRNAGYTIYYMGINIGAGAAPLIGMFIAQGKAFREFIAGQGMDPAMVWKIAFAVPAAGMVFGLIQYFYGYKKLGEAGMHPTVPNDPIKAGRDVTVLKTIIASFVLIIGGGIIVDKYVFELSKQLIGNIFGVGLLIAAIAVFVGFFKTARDAGERSRVAAMIPLFIGAIAFFALFEQASTTMTLYTERLVDRDLLGFFVPASFYQFWNAIFIVILAAPFAAMWLRLGKAGREPSSVNKFGIGMVFAALSFCVMLPSLGDANTGTWLLWLNAPAENASNLVSPYYLIVFYFVSTLSELFISPVGLSSMNGLAPKRLAGMVMGTWFLATAIGNYLAGRAASISEGSGYGYLFKLLIISALVVAAALFLVAPRIKRMMEGKTSSAPLPSARTVDD
jgi:POT family proton-dependent oligopeptide transporter